MNPAAGKLLRGQVMHQRMRPVPHRFVYPVFYIRVNLARLHELNSFWFGVNKSRPASLRTRDYGARDGSDLQTWMRALLQREGIEADGEIWLQTFPRLFGFVFNPVSFWYCHDRNGALQAVLAEVNNTFGESHRYLLSSSEPITLDTELISKKNMHVSPFCAVTGQYRFQFRETDGSSFISLDYFDEQGLLIKTALGGRSRAMTAGEIRNAVLRQPWLICSVVFGIHWQALRLWIKGVPWFSKPAAPDSNFTLSSKTNGKIQEEPTT